MSCLFIDSSYVSFQCFFRTKKWYVANHSHDDVLEWHNNKIFMNKYEKNYVQIIRRIVKNRNISWKNVIIVKDCHREDIWRHDIYDKYKANREENNKHFTGGLVFKYTHYKIFPDLQETYGCKVVRIDHAEADDTIFILHREFRKRFPKESSFILTVDSDYVQLLDANTFIINIYNTVIKKIENVEEYVLYKLLNGDKSDNITLVELNTRYINSNSNIYTCLIPFEGINAGSP